MTLRLAVTIVLALGAAAHANPQLAAPCPACKHGEELIAKYQLEPLRVIAGDLTPTLADPLPAADYARVVALRTHTPALARAGALDDAELDAVAAALCNDAGGACATATARTLRCAADRCIIALPPPPPRIDLLVLPKDCQSYGTHQHSPAYGAGFDWGNGWQQSKYPTDGRAWSIGISGRMRITNVVGAVARVDRIAGRDEATDANHDGKDDVSTGGITRISALAGPTFVLDKVRLDDSIRFLRVDVLGGYLSTRSQPNESGPAAGIDIAYQLSSFRFGVRAVQGFADARDATMILVHMGYAAGSRPQLDDDFDCGASSTARPTRLAFGVLFPLGGYGFSDELGYAAPGIGLELAWHVSPHLDAITRADLLQFPGYKRDRVIEQAALAGVRIFHGHKSSSSTNYSSTIMAGYTQAAGLTPTHVGSGAVGDVSFGWGAEDKDAAAYIRLHARFGLGPDNFEYRALYLSVGGEFRLDPRAWRDRN